MVRTVSPLHTVLDRMVTLSRAMDDALGGDGNGHVSWSPAVDAVETPSAYVLTLDLPGLGPDAVEVVFDRNTLSVRGAREIAVAENARATWRERPAGRFERNLRFPQHVDGDKVTAEFRNGVLTITVPKSESARPRSIAVNSAN